MTYVTCAEAGLVLGLSVETVRVLARRGQLTRYYPAGRPGYGLRFARSEVMRLARARGIRPETTIGGET